MRTAQAQQNEPRLVRAIRDFDANLRLRFNRKWNCYYISREPDACLNRSSTPHDEVLKSFVLDSLMSPHGEAAELGEVVVLAEIPMKIMEHQDLLLRCVRKHLKENFMPALANERMTRLQLADEKLMKEHNVKKERSERNFKDEMAAFGRDFHRTNLTPHVSFAGV
jgi:hypothetical protein